MPDDLNENEINGKQVGTSKAVCCNSMTKCARNHQPQLLYLSHVEVDVGLVNESNWLTFEMLASKADEREKDLLCSSGVNSYYKVIQQIQFTVPHCKQSHFLTIM